MGMFDTIILDKQFQCDCGEKINDFQIKCFDNLLEYYCIGDFVTSATISGIIKDYIYCSKCGKKHDCFILIKNSILYGVYYEENIALEEIQKPLDRLFLLDKYYETFKELKNLRIDYNTLLNKIGLYYSYREKVLNNPDYKADIIETIHINDYINLDEMAFLKKIQEDFKPIHKEEKDKEGV